jgi:hypothetical protein
VDRVFWAASHCEAGRKQAGCNIKVRKRASLTCCPADHAPPRGHNQLAADLHKTAISGQIEALETPDAMFFQLAKRYGGHKNAHSAKKFENGC